MAPSKHRPVRLVVTLVVGAALAVLVVWPQAYGAQTALLISHAIAFRGLLAIVLAVVALLIGLIAWRRRTWGIAAGLAIVLGVAAVANAGILLARGGGSGDVAQDGDLRALVWNTLRDGAPPPTVARVVLATEPDIVSFPEMGEQDAEEVARLLEAEGYGMSTDTAFGDTGASDYPISVLIAERLGEYRIDDAAGSTPNLPSAVWRSADGAGPTIVAAHPFPPFPWGMDHWRAGMQWVADQCDDPDVIVAGDLNATVDHLSGLGDGIGIVGGCRDAAIATGAAASGTWPIPVPAWLAAPIDHVLVGSDWTVVGARVVTDVDDAGSDHRPILVVLEAR